ncbi:hypothetical protein [Streptomyces cremeus]|uniref:Secreted protein n=1 Tax=Streptomyces cremeus TaxID=66881 RepID=A0ABV5PI78_STRCM
MARHFRGLSPRSWLILVVFTATLLLLVGLPNFAAREERSSRDGAGAGGGPAPAVAPRPDRKLAGGATARLSRCGLRGDVRPAARGAGERSGEPALTVLSWTTNGPEPTAAAGRTGADVSLTVFAALRAGERPLRTAAPLFAGRGTVDVVAPFGSGLSASADGLTATVVQEGPDAAPAEPPASGVHRLAPGERLLLKVDVPAEAVCPGRTPLDVIACSAEDADVPAEACPSLLLTFTDPGLRAHRAKGSARPPRTFSDRLVAVLPDPSEGLART